MQFSDHPESVRLSLTLGLFRVGGIHSAQPATAQAFWNAATALMGTLESSEGVDLAYVNRADRTRAEQTSEELDEVKGALLQLLNGTEVDLPSENYRRPLAYAMARLGRGDFHLLK